jgi:Ser/Thr protein kinase RdoA (MazF antagonist)
MRGGHDMIGGVRPGLLLPTKSRAMRHRLLFDIGAWLGAFHASSSKVEAGQIWSGTAHIIQHQLKRAEPSLITPSLREAARLARKIESAHPNAAGSQALLHTDFISRNIRINGTRIGVLDIGVATRGPVRHDLACFMVEHDLLLGACFSAPHYGALNGGLEPFLRGYASRAPLPDEKSLAAMYFLRVVMNWTEALSVASSGPAWAKPWLHARAMVMSWRCRILAQEALSIVRGRKVQILGSPRP